MLTKLSQAAYERLPVAGQNLALAVFGLRYRWERLGRGFDGYVDEFRARDRWSPERMREHADDRLRRILTLAFDETDYYRGAWKDAGIERADLLAMTATDLARIPITPKEQLRSDPHAFVCSSARRGRLIEHRTSGTTGTPTSIFSTAQTVRRWVAIREARSYGWAGASIRMPRATIGARMIVPRPDDGPPFYRYNHIERQIYLSAFHLSPEHVGDYVAGLERHRPMVLTGLAHSLYLLAVMMAETGRRLGYRPRAAILGGEKPTPEMRKTIADVLRTKTFEEYGSVENCVLATECEEGRLHVSPDFGVLEIIDSEGRPVPAGRPGRLVCTGLLNEAQPLVRYEIGDLGAWRAGNCPCGRDHMPIVEGIAGRSNDVLFAPDGRRIVGGFGDVFRGARHVREGQIIQEALDSFVVRVVTTPHFSREQEMELQEKIKRRFGNVRVEVTAVERLERTAAGKVRSVINRIPQQGEGAQS